MSTESTAAPQQQLVTQAKTFVNDAYQQAVLLKGLVRDSINNGEPVHDLEAAVSALAQKLADTAADEQRVAYKVLLDALASAFSAAAIVCDTAADLDEKHHLSAKMLDAAKRVQGNILKAQAHYTTMRATVELPLQKALDRLQEVTSRVKELGEEAFKEGREHLAAAGSEIEKSLHHLRSAPATEMPYVATLEALSLARSALQAVGEGVAAGRSAATAAAISTFNTAKDTAMSAVAEATTQLMAARDAARTKAASMAERGVDMAVQHAAQIDASLNITEKLKAYDQQYGVSSKAVAAATRAQELAASIDAQHNVVDRAKDLLERAKDIDTSLTGGRVANLAGRALEVATTLAGQGVDFAKDIAFKFEAAKTAAAAVTTTATTANVGSSCLATATVTSPNEKTE